MDDNRYRIKGINILDIIEHEMVMLWCTDEIPNLIKEDEEFIEVITSALMLEKRYWKLRAFPIKLKSRAKKKLPQSCSKRCHLASSRL